MESLYGCRGQKGFCHVALAGQVMLSAENSCICYSKPREGQDGESTFSFSSLDISKVLFFSINKDFQIFCYVVCEV